MLNLKKTAAAVLFLGSSAVFAGTMGPVCSAVNVTVPCESSAWGFGAEALYLEPASASGSASYIAQNGQGKYLNYPSKWAWGFKLEGSYHYGTGNDTNLNWYHVSKSATKSFSGANTFTDFGTTSATTVGSASTDPKWDAVNLEFGQRVDFGDNKNIRFHGGVEYARVANSTTLTVADGSTFSGSSSNNPTFNGFGPRVGADMSYDWGNGLGIYANGATALLVGTSKFSRTFAYYDTDLAVADAGSASASHTTIVPEMEAKLGVKYDYAMAQGDLTLDLGWMWVNYFNAQQSQLSTGSDMTHNDFGLQGLYFGLKWLGNVA